MDIVLALSLGIPLSAACGFRVFIPPLMMSLAALYGDLTLGEGFEWLGTYPALITLAVATGVEVLAYYLPVVDNVVTFSPVNASRLTGSSQNKLS